MTKEEYSQKCAQVEAITNQPCDTWQNALSAIGIPAEVVKGALKYKNQKVVKTYLWFCIPKYPEECLTLKVHHEAEEQALKGMKELLDYASKQLN